MMYPMPRGRTTPLLSALFRDRSPRDLRQDTRSAIRFLGLLAIPLLMYQERFAIAIALVSVWGLYEAYHHWLARNAKSREVFLREMVAAIEMRDLSDPGHGKRVANMATIIGRAAGLGDAELEDLRLAAHLHDIGKMSASYAAVLNKNGPLTDQERHLIESHPGQGAIYVMMFEELAHLAPPIHDHHENWNGTGYPHGLAGHSISRHARFIRIADSMDAMMHKRPYRDARSNEYVRSELSAGRGTLFDPHLIDIALTAGCWAELLGLQGRPGIEGAPADDDLPVRDIGARVSPSLGVRPIRAAVSRGSDELVGRAAP
ncbi:MAG: HD domain-containing protein [Gemmatimonadaceae bacterium]|nr:HD domain-containing protein [Gemmatimonadaceae bacterium]